MMIMMMMMMLSVVFVVQSRDSRAPLFQDLTDVCVLHPCMNESRLASAGVRALPIGYDANPADVKRILEGVNGLFLPGGIPPPTDGVRQVPVQVQQPAPARNHSMHFAFRFGRLCSLMVRSRVGVVTVTAVECVGRRQASVSASAAASTTHAMGCGVRVWYNGKAA